MNTRTSRPAGHRSVSTRNTHATILLNLYDSHLNIVFRRPNNGTFGPLSLVHISGLYRYHSKSIFFFITFDFVKVTTKSSFQACQTINFVHYVVYREKRFEEKFCQSKKKSYLCIVEHPNPEDGAAKRRNVLNKRRKACGIIAKPMITRNPCFIRKQVFDWGF